MNGGDERICGERREIFEALEAIPQLKRLGRALTHSTHSADPGGLARHEAEMPDDLDLLMRESAHRVAAAACQDRVGAPGDRREGGAQNLVRAHRLRRSRARR